MCYGKAVSQNEPPVLVTRNAKNKWNLPSIKNQTLCTRSIVNFIRRSGKCRNIIQAIDKNNRFGPVPLPQEINKLVNFSYGIVSLNSEINIGFFFVNRVQPGDYRTVIGNAIPESS